MNLSEIMAELEALGNERIKKRYMGQGAREPLFGVASGALKPLAKKLMNNQEICEELYNTGNYDAMYLAGMIADVKRMTPDDFRRWIKKAYFYMISDFIVAVTLAETDFAATLSDEFIESGEELVMSAGWSCYEWLLGWKKDSELNEVRIKELLAKVKEEINSAPNRTKYAMNRFLAAVGVSFLPLHDEALQIAKELGEITIEDGKSKQVLNAYEIIQKEVNRGKVGFKRRHVRC